MLDLGKPQSGCFLLRAKKKKKVESGAREGIVRQGSREGRLKLATWRPQSNRPSQEVIMDDLCSTN